MNDFEKIISDKTDAELLKVLEYPQDYQPEFVALVKKEIIENRNISFASLQNEQKEDKNKSESKERIHGWLTFFLFIIGLGGILTPITTLFTTSLSDYDLGYGYWVSVFGVISEGVLSLGIAVLAIYTVISFFQFKPNAVKLGKAYLIIVFATNLISLLGEVDQNVIGKTIFRLFGQSLWFMYLSFSQQVKSLFPKEKRKLLNRDKVLLFSIISPVVIWFIVVFALAFIEGLLE